MPDHDDGPRPSAEGDGSGGGGKGSATTGDGAYSAFLSYSHDSKEDVARPLVEGLKERGVSVWWDEEEVGIGDILRDKIKEGIGGARYGIVIVSPGYLESGWGQTELGDMFGKKLTILPILHGVGVEAAKKKLPAISESLMRSWDDSPESIMGEIARKIKAGSRAQDAASAPDHGDGGGHDQPVKALLSRDESEVLEFKPWLTSRQDGSPKPGKMSGIIARELCGFANSKGGDLLIGVINGGKVAGLAPGGGRLSRRQRNEMLAWMTDVIVDYLGVEHGGRFDCRIVEVDGRDVLHCAIAPSEGGPVILKKRLGGKHDFFVRVGSTCRALGSKDMLEYIKTGWPESDKAPESPKSAPRAAPRQDSPARATRDLLAERNLLDVDSLAFAKNEHFADLYGGSLSDAEKPAVLFTACPHDLVYRHDVASHEFRKWVKSNASVEVDGRPIPVLGAEASIDTRALRVVERRHGVSYRNVRLYREFQPNGFLEWGTSSLFFRRNNRENVGMHLCYMIGDFQAFLASARLFYKKIGLDAPFTVLLSIRNSRSLDLGNHGNEVCDYGWEDYRMHSPGPLYPTTTHNHIQLLHAFKSVREMTDEKIADLPRHMAKEICDKYGEAAPKCYAADGSFSWRLHDEASVRATWSDRL